MRLIRGASGSGKTDLVFREFKAALLQSAQTPRIIVPTATLVRHFQHELARDGVVFPPSSVISLSRFVAERAPAAKVVPDGLWRAMVRETLRRLNLPEFAEVSTTAGMTATIVDTIGLFENAGCTPEKLAGVRRLSAHGRAFERVWRAVDKAVRECGFVTRAGIMRAAAANLEPLTVWMDGFIHFSPLESDLVSALSRTCELTLTMADTPAADDICKLALSLGASDKLLPGGPRKAVVTAVAAPSMPREADEIARRILNLNERGTAFREIGVALRDAGAYLPLLRGTFERFGIPARYYFATPLRRHPAALFLGGLIACTLNGWEFGAALDALRAHPAWGNSAAFDRFDFTVREAMPGHGAEALLALCEPDLQRRIGDCLAVDAWRNDRMRPAVWQHRFEQLAQSLYRPGMLEAAHDHAAVESARSHVFGMRAWVDAIASAAEFWVDEAQQVTLSEFWHVAAEAVEAASIHIPDDRRDVVHVMSVYEARQWDVCTLFVCGVTDRDYPKRNAPNLLFPDGEIDALYKSGIRLRKASDLDREEEELFASLRSRARDSLVLSYPEHDAAGKSVSSSRFLAEQCPLPHGRGSVCKPELAVNRVHAGREGRIEAPALLTALAGLHPRISLSRLEDLAQCRFKFFAGQTLGLRERPERPEERLHAGVTGLILHKALEAWLNVQREGEFVAQFEAAFDDMCRQIHLPPGYRLEVERMNYREIARRVSAYKEPWTPESSQAEVELTLDFPGGITVAGRVDRIDRLNDRDCIIVDYKSSKVANVEKLVKSEVKLQGPLYALAARERLNLNTIAMMYVAVREDKPFGWGAVPGADLELLEMPPRWMEDARDRSIARLADFLSGAIQPAPAEPDQCKWCDFKGACRVEQGQMVTIGARGA
ncbi:MAG: PD-(D/E)XK nuclease family protein [Bryobacteraceae bacterium]|jgi:ATP-dependent helicase/DNAse subunit B